MYKRHNFLGGVKRRLAGALVISMLMQDMSSFASVINLGGILSGNRSQATEATASSTKNKNKATKSNQAKKSQAAPLSLTSGNGQIDVNAPELNAEFSELTGGQAAVSDLGQAISINKKNIAEGHISINTNDGVEYFKGVQLHLDLPYIIKDAEGNVGSFYGKFDDIAANGYVLLGGVEVSFQILEPWRIYDPTNSANDYDEHRPPDMDISQFMILDEAAEEELAEEEELLDDETSAITSGGVPAI